MIMIPVMVNWDKKVVNLQDAYTCLETIQLNYKWRETDKQFDVHHFQNSIKLKHYYFHWTFVLREKSEITVQDLTWDFVGCLFNIAWK